MEIHPTESEEVYVKTDYNCVPSADGVSLPATGGTLAGFGIQRLE